MNHPEPSRRSARLKSPKLGHTDLSPQSLIRKANSRIPMTHAEIGALLGCSQQRVQQIEAKALAKMAVPMSGYMECES